ncbi:hypothetical protein [Methylobacterium sp. WSM2598]|uniref:hypothetical protein n=1 Tax=Methylobacterium sp. WSM2598 TaxID=398261 RepID=UPI0003713B0E|nr:hypothetical protein [Methylobacterium sp. WSM2598]
MAKPDPLITPAEAARLLGLNKSTLHRQVKSGAVRSHDGKVRLSEVKADRARNVDAQRSARHAGKTDRLTDAAETEEAAAPDAGGIYTKARARREFFSAKLRELEYRQKEGELAPIAVMIAAVDRDFGVVRERILAVPGKLSGDLDPRQVERLTDELHEALEQLSDPNGTLFLFSDRDGSQGL